MDWSRSYTSRWRLFKVNPVTWADVGQVPKADSADIERVRGGMLESGSIKVTRDVGQGFDEGYYRIALYAEQDGESLREDIATLYCTCAESEVERGREVVEIEGRSVLYPAGVRKLLAGTYAPKGCDGAEYAAQMLRECLAAPVEVGGSFRLGSHVVFDLGAAYIDAVWDVLEAGGFCLQVTGGGTVRVVPLPTEPALELPRARMRMLAPDVQRALDYSGVPNRYFVRDGDDEALAVNDDQASPTSTVTRGYFHDAVDTSPRLLDGESLATYARRRLAEESRVEDARTYRREYWPGVLPYSVVRCTIPGAGLDGVMRVARQSLSLGHGIHVTEQAVMEVATWQG